MFIQENAFEGVVYSSGYFVYGLNELMNLARGRPCNVYAFTWHHD